jgi:hypothetical protein
MSNYIVCYPGGASGRFLSAIIYKIANKMNEVVLTTDVNSGHLESENKIILGYDLVENNNHPFVFKDLIPNNLSNIIPVFSTHAFPKFKIINEISHFDTTKFITILYEPTDYKELVANLLIKARVPQIKTILNSQEGVEQFKNKTYFYGVVYLITKFKDIYGYDLTLDNLFNIDTIKNLYDLDLKKRKRRNINEEELGKFKTPINIPDSFKDRMLVIQYKDIFIKTKTSYIALEQLSNFTGSTIPSNIMDSYVKYVNNQQLMLDKYFPWLTDYQIM